MLLILSTLSCTNLYNHVGGDDVYEIRIERYNNYYEGLPQSEVVVREFRDLKDILRPLRFLYFWGLESKNFKGFDDSKIVVHFISDTTVTLQIIRGRLEVRSDEFYRINIIKESKFIDTVTNF